MLTEATLAMHMLYIRRFSNLKNFFGDGQRPKQRSMDKGAQTMQIIMNADSCPPVERVALPWIILAMRSQKTKATFAATCSATRL